jgi:hypothetical protein
MVTPLDNSHTPRTDGIVFKAQPGMMPPYDTVPAEFSRTLERELCVALEKLAAAERSFIEINMVAPIGEVSALTFRAIQSLKESA